MCLCPNGTASRRWSGLTLLEMLISISIMSIIALAMGGMAMSVRQTTDYTQGRGAAMQHGRVALERINRLVSGAYTAPSHPGAVVVYDLIGAYRFPDTLLVWRPAGDPANPSGPPLMSEVVIVCPDPAAPSQLVEITAPTDSRQVPFDASTLNTTAWRNALVAIKTANTSQKTVLTDLLRTASATSNGSTSGTGSLRGAVRFECELHPTAAEWTAYKAGTLAWSNMAWAQSLYNTNALTGLRQVWVRSELQLMPDDMQGQQDTTGQRVIPFFGSTALYYTLTGP